MYFVATDADGRIQDLFHAQISPEVPPGTTPISPEDADILRKAVCFGDYTLQAGRVVADAEAHVARARTDKVTEIKAACQAEILTAYPLWKQVNINELQGYTQADKDGMWQVINAARIKSDDLEAQVAAAATIEAIETIVW